MSSIVGCHGCGRTIEGPTPGAGIVRVPCACGFVNLFEDNVEVLPLYDDLETSSDKEVVESLMVDTDDPARCRQVLERTFTLMVDRARQTVVDDPIAATAARWHTLVEFERRSRRFRAGARDEIYLVLAVARAVQMLEASLFETVDVVARETSDVPAPVIQAFVSRFFRSAASAATLAPMLDLLRNDLAVARIHEGRFELRKTPSHSRYQEWMINRDRIERGAYKASDDELFSAAAAEAVEAWLGFSPAVGRTLFANKHKVLVDLAAKKTDTVYAIPKDACPANVGGLLDRFTLTKSRAQRFELPFFWDLGQEAAAGGAADLTSRLASRNWLVYYPVLEGIVAGKPAFLASGEALTHAIATLEPLKNGMLQRIVSVLASGPPAEARLKKRVNQLRVSANRRFEELGASLGRSLGFEAAHGLERVDGKLIDGGEIDLLWVRPHNGRLVWFLAELKDFDVALHRVGSEPGLRKRIEAAEAQLDRKANTVRREWRRLLPIVTEGRILNHHGEVILGKAVLTSAYLPPHLAVRYPLLTFAEMKPLIEELNRWPHDFAPRFAGSAVERLSV